MENGSTIRQARNAVSLILDGAVRRIENNFGPEGDAHVEGDIRTLFQEVVDAIADWEVAGTFDDVHDRIVVGGPLANHDKQTVVLP